MIKYVEHSSRGYAPRTKHNATTAGLTIALAADLHTAGELLTHKMAGMRYLGFRIDTELMNNPLFLTETASRIARECEYKNVKILNVAGNGIYTLNHHGITQAKINLFIYQVLKYVCENSAVHTIISGGQTGVDFAAGVAAEALHKDCVLTFPQGFLQRGLDKIDKTYTAAQIEQKLKDQVAQLKIDIENLGPHSENTSSIQMDNMPQEAAIKDFEAKPLEDTTTLEGKLNTDLNTFRPPVKTPAFRFAWMKK